MASVFLPVFGWRYAETASETAIEVRHLAKAARIGNIADLHAVVAAVGKHPSRFLQPQFQHALREAGAGLDQEVLDIPPTRASRSAPPGQSAETRVVPVDGRDRRNRRSGYFLRP
jgi:hypothetical protein